MPVGAGISARPTVATVVLKIDARASTGCGSTNAVSLTGALGAHFVLFAGGSTGTAVLSAGVCVDTGARAVLLIVFAVENTAPTRTHLTCCCPTGISTSPTVLRIGLCVDTRIVTRGLTTGAIQLTDSVFAGFALFTLCPTGSTVSTGSFKVEAGVVASDFPLFAIGDTLPYFAYVTGVT